MLLPRQGTLAGVTTQRVVLSAARTHGCWLARKVHEFGYSCDGFSMAFMGLQVLDRILSPKQEYHPSIQFVYYLQYHLHCQLLEVSVYAAEHRVALKGDLPIGAFCLCPHKATLRWGPLEGGHSEASKGLGSRRAFRTCVAMQLFCTPWFVAGKGLLSELESNGLHYKLPGHRGRAGLLVHVVLFGLGESWSRARVM
jgi:4-alpha-glucanotransferase